MFPPCPCEQKALRLTSLRARKIESLPAKDLVKHFKNQGGINDRILQISLGKNCRSKPTVNGQFTAIRRFTFSQKARNKLLSALSTYRGILT